MVIWLLGISGAGKSTLANKLKTYLESRDISSFLLDGDVVRDFFDNDLGFTPEEREQNIKRIMLASHVLEKSGTIAIVANISPFEKLRKLARLKFDDYVQIHLDKNIEVAQKSDVKGVYQNNQASQNLVGVDIAFEPPEFSDLVIDVDNESVETSIARIIALISERI